MALDFYTEFENNFRGSREQIIQVLSNYDGLLDYILKIDNEPTLLDIGSGRGEWIQKCNDVGFYSIGIELNANMANDCKKLNLNIKQGDALSLLDEFSENSFSIVSAFHVIEHMNFQDIEKLLHMCKRILKPEGILILETPSIDNFLVSTKSFYIDPTHINPIHPELLAFMIKRNGYSKLKYYFINGGPLEEAMPDTLTRVLNGVAQDLVLIASKSNFIDNKVFKGINLIKRDMKIGITSLEAAIDFDNYSRKRYSEYDNKISMMQDQIINLEKQLLFYNKLYRISLIPVVIKIIRKFIGLYINLKTKIKKIITILFLYLSDNHYFAKTAKKIYKIKYIFFILRFFERVISKTGFNFYFYKFVKKSKKNKEDSDLVLKHDRHLDSYYHSSVDAKSIFKDLNKKSNL